MRRKVGRPDLEPGTLGLEGLRGLKSVRIGQVHYVTNLDLGDVRRVAPTFVAMPLLKGARV